MGRAKIAMKYIENEKARKLSFNQRINGLTSKISEFSKSGAKACLIVYNDDDNDVGPITWPKNPTMVTSMLQEYEHQKIETTPTIFDVKDYFENKKSFAEIAIIKVRKEIIKNKYPTWNPSFNNMEVNDLKSFIATIDDKIQVCNEKLSMLKNMQQGETSFLQSTPMKQVSQAPMKSIDDISEKMDFTNLVDLPSNSSTKQCYDFTNLVDLPPSSSSKQCGEIVKKCGNEVANHDDEFWAQLADLDYWPNQFDVDTFNWANQPGQFFWKDDSFLSPNKEVGASMNSLIQPKDTF